jgi:hypothetical protein
MEIKMHDHNFRRMFFDILRDTNTAKYSMTKFAALVGLFLLTLTIIAGLIIMWSKGEIDHIFVIELIGFVLTLLGFKNSFGFKGKDGQTINTTGNTDNNVAIVGGNENSEVDPDAGKKLRSEGSLVCGTKKPADFVDDSLKG